MTMFLIQSLLLLLAAFLLGYGIARWLKGVFCKRKQVAVYTKPSTDHSHLRVPVTTAAVTTGTAATAALARSRQEIKPTVTVKQPEVKAPTVTVKSPEVRAEVSPIKVAELHVPKADIKAPEVTVATPSIDVRAPKVTVPAVDVTVPNVELHLPKVDVAVPTIDLPKVDVDLKAPSFDLPKVDVTVPAIDLPKLDVSAPSMDLPKVDVDVPTIDLSKLDLKAPTVDLPQVDVNVPSIDLPKVDVTIPNLSASLPTVDTKLPEVELPKIEVKEIATGIVGLGAAAVAASVAAFKLKAPDGEVDLTVTEVKPPELDVDLKTLQMNLPESKADVSVVEWHNQEVSADIVTVNVPDVQVDLPDAGLPKLDVSLAAANLQTPEGKVDLTALRVDVPDTAIHLPAAGIDFEHAKLGVGRVELNTPEGLYTVEGAKVQALDQPEAAGAVRLTKPDGDVQVASFATDTNGHINLAAADNGSSGLELETVELSSMQPGLVNKDWLISLKEAALAQGNTVLASAVDQAITTTTQSANQLTSIDIGSAGAGLSPDWLAGLKTAVVGAGLGVVVAKATDSLAASSDELDESDMIEEVKNAADDVGRTHTLVGTDIGIAGQGLNAEFLTHLKAPTPTTVVDVMANRAADALANQPQAIDESDLIESKKNIVEALLNPTGLTTTEIGSLGQSLNTDTLAGLTMVAASAGTVEAVQANLQSGVQPMIVDESDAIEAIKLAWDGELSPAELAALEHTLILRPGETGRLGLVTCSVPSGNCVSLGGLEGDLPQGDAMRSNLFNMAVTHNDDGNYIFSSLSKWMPNWVKSGESSEHTDEQINLVWDNDPTVIEHTAGYQLTLRAGQYGDLGTVSCAVNEPGSVSLGGIVGSIADGQTVVSKLYGLVIERAGDIYTFKQFAKRAANDSWLDTAKVAAVAVGAGVAAQASGAVDSVKDMVMPITKSETTDMLEPDLDWSDDKIRVGVHRLIAESHDRRGSKLVSQLWDSDSGYDCGFIEGEESLILKPGLYGKLGSIHCGVTKPGRVVVSGDVSPLNEGEGVLFHLYNIVVCRDDEDNYRFERLKDLV